VSVSDSDIRRIPRSPISASEWRDNVSEEKWRQWNRSSRRHENVSSDRRRPRTRGAQPPPIVQSGPGVDTNVYEGNVNLLSSAQLGLDAVVTLKGCHAGLKPAQNPRGHSIAQLIANQLTRPVKAWKVGMFFSPDSTSRYPKGDGPSAEPVYMLPEGGNAVQPCTFMPNQPEPVKCGGAR
jgi:hypothetical protein